MGSTISLICLERPYIRKEWGLNVHRKEEVRRVLSVSLQSLYLFLRRRVMVMPSVLKEDSPEVCKNQENNV